jgi:hypothetical protein
MPNWTEFRFCVGRLDRINRINRICGTGDAEGRMSEDSPSPGTVAVRKDFVAFAPSRESLETSKLQDPGSRDDPIINHSFVV